MSRKKRKGLYFVGETVDGKGVMGGVFFVRDTHGMPLDLICDILKEKGRVVSWEDYIRDALKAGWKPSMIKNDIFYSIGITQPEDIQKEIKIKNDLLLARVLESLYSVL